MKVVVAGLIKQDGKYLLAKRATGPKELIGLWEFPGGKVEPNETDEAALEREIIEEFNTVVKVGKFLASAQIDNERELRLYACEHVLGPFRPKDHSEIVWCSTIQSFSSYELAPADRELLEKIGGGQKKPHLNELRVGATYENSDLVRILRVSPQGGMRLSKTANALVLISKHDTNNPYDDVWRNGEFHYTGMGLSGDQDMYYRQNRTVAESKTNGIDMYLFESFEANAYTYRGQVQLCGEPYYETQKDTFGRSRKVVKFPLALKK